VSGAGTMRRITPRRGAWLALLAGLSVLGGCGGAGSPAAISNPPPPTGSNVAPMLIDAGSAALTFNLPSVSVTICAPGTANCQTIDHILVDTASSGLRIFSSVLNTPAALPDATTAAGNPMWECMIFADGYSWGSVRRADVQVADGKASNLEVQVIGDPAIPTAPADCSGSGGPPENTVGTFGNNGVLGVSVFAQDCGSACVTVASPGGLGFYYDCPASGCVNTTASLATQVQNPVTQFASNNNGVVVVLPKISNGGQASADGSLVLGVDTQSNNQVGSATILTLDPGTGFLTTVYNGVTAQIASVFDTGSNGIFFNDSTLPACSSPASFYCPPSIRASSATNQGANGVTSDVSFNVANANSLTTVNPGFAAFNDVAGTFDSTNQFDGFDWGLPFFYGRSVYIVFEGQPAAAGTGPLVAY